MLPSRRSPPAHTRIFTRESYPVCADDVNARPVDEPLVNFQSIPSPRLTLQWHRQHATLTAAQA